MENATNHDGVSQFIDEPYGTGSGSGSGSGIGFIIIRHINNVDSMNYWFHSYECIRKFYTSPIVIIDDHSLPEFLESEKNIENEKNLVHCIIQKSEFPKRAELLPYYYFYQNHYFEKAVIIHDSVFIQEFLDFSGIQNIQFLWKFEHWFDPDEECIHLLNQLIDSEHLVRFYHEKHRWKGCFGTQSVISYDFLKKIVDKHDFFRLLSFIVDRGNRSCLERVFAAVCSFHDEDVRQNASMFGDIFDYCPRRNMTYYFDHYYDDLAHGRINKKIIKVWSGR